MQTKLISFFSHRNFLIFSIPTFALLNAIVQFYLSSSTPLVRWKGGGFGMYSAIHFEDRNIWLTVTTDEGEYFYHPPKYSMSDIYLIYPIRKNLLNLVKELPLKDLRAQGKYLTTNPNASEIGQIRTITATIMDTGISIENKNYFQEIVANESFNIEQLAK